MTSSRLSEQVALLEDARDFYRAARDELIDDNETLKAERDDLQRQANEARDEHHKFTAALGFGDGVTDPSATYDDMLEPMQRAMQDSLEHNECPIICEMCGEWLANTACEHCHGSGCDSSLSRSDMAYVECEWCGGAGKIHPGCAEKSYSDLVAEVDELRAKTVSAEQVEAAVWEYLHDTLTPNPSAARQSEWSRARRIVTTTFRAAGFLIERDHHADA